MRFRTFVIGCAALLPSLAAAHGNEVIVDQLVNGYLAEFSYDERDIRAGEFFDFHSSLMEGDDAGSWDFAPYTEMFFEIRRGGERVFTKTFATTALGFAGVTFAEPGEHELIVRFIDRPNESIIAEVTFPFTVGPARQTPLLSPLWRDAALGGTVLAVAAICLAPFIRRKLGKEA